MKKITMLCNVNIRNFVLIILTGLCLLGSACRQIETPEYSYKFDFSNFGLNEYNTTDNNFKIPLYSIKRFLKYVEQKESAKAIKLGNSVFRVNGLLPRGYVNLMSNYLQPNPYRIYNNEVYNFEVGNGYELTLAVAPKQALITSFAVKAVSGKRELNLVPSRLTDRRAFQLLKNYIDYYDDGSVSPDSNSYWIKPKDLKPAAKYELGGYIYKDRIRIIRLMNPFAQPLSIEHELIMDNRSGEILNKNALTLTKASNWVFPPSENSDLHKKIMSLVVTLNQDDVHIISKPQDIPGYEVNRLDPDLEKAIVPAFTVIEKDNNKTVYIVYTYQQLEGIIRRYYFKFQNGRAYDAQCMQLANDIGDATYKE